MAKLKTAPTDQSVVKFLNSIIDQQKQHDCYMLLAMMKEITGVEPKMWGNCTVGFGSYYCRYESGEEGDRFLTGFSPRKQNLTIYIMSGLEKQGALLKKLGKHKTSILCLYINSPKDIYLPTLKELISGLVKLLQKRYYQ
ncbi:MAG: hypothetical protein A2Y94_00080 [Caldithrix sp. RBG_13_44_9]|nr:MAG: hypothetical protein A2Y94_00080 [Caldithrix sp. RBG_13_44_9]